MEVRWLKRTNNSGEEEKFYPITHANAIVTDDDTSVGDHMHDTNNPHKVTAEQIGALPLEWITMSTNDIGAGSPMSSLIHIVYEE